MCFGDKREKQIRTQSKHTLTTVKEEKQKSSLAQEGNIPKKSVPVTAITAPLALPWKAQPAFLLLLGSLKEKLLLTVIVGLKKFFPSLFVGSWGQKSELN